MSIFKTAVNKPITTLMIVVGIVVMGIFSLMNIPVDLLPEMDPPYISVITKYPGASAADIETNITRHLEDAFNTVDNLKEVTSVSRDNLSVVSLEFDWGADLNEASNDIRESIDLIYHMLPDNIDRPTIFKFNVSMLPILFYAITAEESYPGLYKILDEKIVNPLNRIDGVGSVDLIGAPKRKVYVEADPHKLNAFNLTLEQVAAVVKGENLNMPSGKIEMGKMNYQLRVRGEVDESDELNNLVVGHYNGASVFLKDVAVLRDTIQDLALEETINGQQGMRLFVMKQSGANTVKIAKNVGIALEKLKKDLPSDIVISELTDTSEFINNSISNLSQTMFWAIFFVILVVLFFLGRWRATIIIGITIPVSLIVSFIYLYITGGSVNIISLASISIALGMVVDDAIVVLENITRHIERGTSPREAAIYATNEVWLSVIVTTLVVVAVFFPLTLVGGMTGVLFNQIGWIVTITVVVSTIAALTLTPMLSSQMLRLRTNAETKKASEKRFSHAKVIEPFLDWVDDFYEKTLRVALVNKKKILLFSITFFVGTLFLVKFIGMDFMPETDQGELSAAIELTNGLRVDETITITRKIEQIIKEGYPEIELISTSSGADDDGGMSSIFSTAGSNFINITMRLSKASQRERSVWDIADALRDQMYEIPEIAQATVNSGSGMSGASSVDLEIYGYDINATTTLAHEFKAKIAAIEGAKDVVISRKDEKAELQLILDKQKLAENGLNTAMVSSAIRNRVTGVIASKLREDGDEYDIVVRFSEEHRSDLGALESFVITNPMGQKVLLGEVGTIKEFFSPPNIERKSRERVVTVKAVPAGISLGDLAQEINKVVDITEVPKGIMLSVGGDYEDMIDSFMDLGILLLISVILVFLVMASQFESFVIPFILMFSIPFSFTGVILALLITNTTLSVIAGIGAVLLIGIVVKNGIVLVDYINLLRDRGVALNEAIATACRTRLRPVLMTAFTTVLAMVPMALSTGEGAEIWKPMGITIIGGLVFSTLVTLVLIPVLYGIVSRKGERDKLHKIRNQYTFINNK